MEEKEINTSDDRKRESGDRLSLLLAYLSGVITVLLILVGILLIVRYRWPSEQEASPEGLAAAEKLRTITALIDAAYVGEVDEAQMAEEMYRGLIKGLDDPYSAYMTEEEYKSVRTTQLGKYKGIGVEVTMTEDGTALLIQNVQSGMPAEEAGLLTGDRITSIAGEAVAGKTLTEATALIKQCEEDRILLTVEREGEKEPLEIEVSLTELDSSSVASAMVADSSTGYIRISSFTALTPEQFGESLDSLREQGADSLIIDLRNNPGGLRVSVCDTLRLILPEGLIVYTINKQGKRVEYLCDGETPLEMPLVVLVNGNTVSDAEIFTGAVQDYGIGTIVGTTTYGKGLVQDVFTLPDNSVVKLTISHYYTPNGKDIHGIGITPDVEVELPADAEKDLQMIAALDILGVTLPDR